MKKTQGFGLIGMLIAVLIVGILMAAILKRYAGQTRQMMSVPGLTQPAAPSQTPGAKAGVQPAPARNPCNGRQVGSICVPTEVRSSSLDAFEQMNK